MKSMFARLVSDRSALAKFVIMPLIVGAVTIALWLSHSGEWWVVPITYVGFVGLSYLPCAVQRFVHLTTAVVSAGASIYHLWQFAIAPNGGDFLVGALYLWFAWSWYKSYRQLGIDYLMKDLAKLDGGNSENITAVIVKHAKKGRVSANAEVSYTRSDGGKRTCSVQQLIDEHDQNQNG